MAILVGRRQHEGSNHPRWNVHGWPTLYLLDAKGVIRYKGDRLRSISLEKAVNGNWRQVTVLEKAVDELMKEMEKGR